MQLKDHIDRGLCSYSDTPFVNISNASTAFPMNNILSNAEEIVHYTVNNRIRILKVGLG